MTIKRKKTSRQRGTSSHGWGAKKKHRGAGHRGGRGEAGSGKRGDAKKPSFWKDKKRYKKIGFTSKVNNKCKTINIQELSNKLDTFVAKEKATLKNNVYTINLSNIKVDKLLGAGNISKKIEINVTTASKLAIKKVESAGGKVIFPKAEVKKKVELGTSEKTETQPKK